jgi:thioredoxin 1
VLEQFAAEKADELVVAKLNIDHDPELAERYGVESIPTLNLYRDGQVVHQFVGAAPKRVLDEEFADHL